KRILTLAEAARYSGYSRGMIEYWLAQGLLKCEQPPSRGNGKHRFRRIRREELDAFVDQYYDQNKDENSKQLNHIYENTVTLLPRENNKQGRRVDL
ncbi:unnamed protein product, partial [marine sediment metagenome]